MSGLLYRIGRGAGRHPWRVVALWLVASLTAMALLGDRAWWLPRRLDRILPDVGLEDGPSGEPGVLPGVAPARHDAPAFELAGRAR